MVRGVRMAVTAVAATYQCAEIASTARGRGSAAPSAAQARVQALACSAFIGLPCPRNTAGKRAFIASGVRCEQLHGRLIEPRSQRQPLARARHVAHGNLDTARGGTHRDAGLRREADGALTTRGAPPF